MSFTSVSFFIFILITIFMYYVMPKRIQWIILLVASYVFYAFAGVKYLGFLLFTTLTTFLAGIFIGKLNFRYKEKIVEITGEEKKRISSGYRKRKKVVVVIALLLNFSILFLLKYYNFALEGINQIFPTVKLDALNILLPLGISFYMFQSIGYVIDVYRGKYEPDKNLFKFALFVSFFPQIIQGPISRYDNLAHQLYEKHRLNFDNLKYGITFMMWGYFKKLIIADRAVLVVNHVFDNYLLTNGTFTLVGVLFYCIQLYCDFSGGIDITRGIAKVFGIDLVENFKRPYYATSLADFWRRWHITLGSWMKDYLFYPLSLSKAFGKLGKFSRKFIGGTLGKILPTSIASFIVFFTIGLWHGGSSKYLFFGLWNGVIIMMSILLEPIYKKLAAWLHINLNSFIWYVFRIFRTSVIVCIGRYFTRAESLEIAFSMLKNTLYNFDFNSLFDLNNWLNLGLTPCDYIVVIIATLIVFALGAIEEKGTDVVKALEKKNAFIQSTIILASIVILIVFGIYRGENISSDFIYKQF